MRESTATLLLLDVLAQLGRRDAVNEYFGILERTDPVARAAFQVKLRQSR